MKPRQRPQGTKIEWVGGTIETPAYVMGEGGDLYRPETVIWLVRNGPILAARAVDPDSEVVEETVRAFDEAVRRPMAGPSHVPSLVRVASPELAERLRAAAGSKIEVVCAPTPELDAVASDMRQFMSRQKRRVDPSYLVGGATPDSVAALFRAAAALFRASPWKFLPGDEVLSISIEQLGVKDAALTVIGQLGESYGLVFYRSLDDFEAFREAAANVQPGAPPQLPPHFSLGFERGKDLDPRLRREISRHGWEVAGAKAYPVLMSVDPDLIARPPTAEELTVAEAAALALVELLRQKLDLGDAFEGGPAVVRTLSVGTHAGQLTVTIRAPYGAEAEPAGRARAKGRTPLGRGGAFDIHADACDPDDGTLDEDWADALVEGFVASPEAESAGADGGWTRTFMDLLARYTGVTVAKLSVASLREVVFELIPRKVSTEPNTAEEIVGELRAFLSYLKRAFGLKNMAPCLRTLGGDAAQRLERDLADESKYGTAKSLVMGGMRAGFDMGSQKGLDAFMRSQTVGSLAAARAPVGRRSDAKTKNKRKAARRARRKNR
jgi:hypothetical protein